MKNDTRKPPPPPDAGHHHLNPERNLPMLGADGPATDSTANPVVPEKHESLKTIGALYGWPANVLARKMPGLASD
jgi:hypothetical protein